VVIEGVQTMQRDRLLGAFGSVWFLLLAIIAIKAMLTLDLSLSHLLARSSIVILYLLFSTLILIRPPAKSHAQGLLPRIMAFVGTYLPWTISFFPFTDYNAANALSPFLVLGGIVLAITTAFHLGTAFSIVPQARSVVRSGPYRWLRHPLYVAEEIAIFGALLQYLSPIPILIVAVHIAVQISRIHYEERLLGETFPHYHMLSANWRLVPFVY
jgi:protein-S-isoprenylcysteine O-methyltransferase Ste14